MSALPALRPSSGSRVAAACAPPPRLFVRLERYAARAWAADRVLVAFGGVMLGLAALFAAATLFDERTLRGVDVWVKPLKFALSIAALAWTTALFTDALEPAARTGRSMRALRWTLVVLASLEIAYIALQGALGEESHYNRSDALHIALYNAMGAAALTLAATQPWLAWLIRRSPRAGLDPTLQSGIVRGLVVAFVLGAGVGIALGGQALPPVRGDLPLFGWSLGRGDLRPAHFVGLHAAQALPLVAAWISARRWPRPTAARALRLATAGWIALFGLVVVGAWVPAGA